MKDFVKMTLAVLCGFFIMWIIGFFLLIGAAGSAAVSGKSKTILPREGVLSIDCSSFQIQEQSIEDPMNLSSFSPQMVPTVGIWSAVRAIKHAAADPGVKYIFLRPDGYSGGIAQLQELRKALSDFRESGKAVVAYTENTDNASYYLATVADKIYTVSNHGGMVQLIGMSGRLIFLKDLLDKLGVNYQLIRHGKYKSAGEMYIKNAPSEENLEQNKAMISSIWNALSSEMAEARGIDVKDLNALVDGLKLNFPEDLLEAGLVDEMLDHEGLVKKLCDLAVVEKSEDLHLIPFADYVQARAAEPISGNVAILFADGQIIEGKEETQVAGNRFVRMIDEIRKDDKIKAVVLRVNSPGGSVLASSKIRSALDLLAEEKPLVASYGNYAASGGYWISNGCQKIFSNPATLTGSIGVFSMIPEFSGTAKKVAHVNVVTVGSNKHSDMFSLMRPFSKEETAYMQAYVEDIYDEFVQLVAKGRDMTPEAVDNIAQGRVWTGSDAVNIGLVDEIGTLQDAVYYAASLGGFVSESDYSVISYPKPMNMFDMLLASFGQKNNEDYVLSGTPFECLGEELRKMTSASPTQVYATIPYCIDIQ